MKRNLWERVLPRPHAKHVVLTLSSVLALSPFLSVLPVEAASLAAIAKTVTVKNISWAGIPDSNVSGDTLTVNISSHTQWANEVGMTLTASSQNEGIATAIVDGNLLRITAKSAGSVLVELRAAKAGRETAVDTIQVDLTRIGDTNGDGNVTSADALYITKVVNTQPPVTDPEIINRLDINRDGVLTKDDSTALLSNYVGKSGIVANTYIVSLKEVNDAPIISQTAINGDLRIQQTLSAAAQYQDVEGDAQASLAYQWYRGTNSDGSDKTAIPGATSSSYTIVGDDVGKYLWVSVTPTASTGTLAGQAYAVRTSVSVPDTTPPELDGSLQPLNTIGKSQMASDFVMTFNEPVKFGAGTVKLRKKSDSSIIESINITDTGKVTFNNQTVTIANPGLADVTAYYLEVTPGAILDLADNPYAGISGSTTWTFTTPDTTPPERNSLLPVKDSVDVKKGDGFQISFNENVKAVAGKNIRIYKADHTPTAVIAADDTQHVTINGSTVTIHHSDLTETEHYYITVDNGAFADLSDNAYAGFDTDSEWTFYVPDITPPVVSSMTPSNGDKGILTSDNLKITFNENVQPVAGKQIVIKNAVTHAQVAAFDVDDLTQVTINGAEVVITAAGLSTDASYYVEVPAGAFKDTAGNDALSFGGATDWSFATVDTIAPGLTASSPVIGGKTSAVNADLTLTFSENIIHGSQKYITVRNAGDHSTVISFASDDSAHVSIAGNTVTLSDLGLAEKQDYEVIIESGAFTDEAGNAYTGIAETAAWTFSTPDLTAPTAVTFTPENQATGVDRFTPLSLTFSEDVKGVSGKHITIYKESDNSVVATYMANDTSKVSISGTEVLLTNPGLADETGYYLEIDNGAFADMSDNPFAGITGSTSWSFTTPDTMAPVMANLLPLNQAEEVSRTADFSITFNEKIQKGTGKVHLYDKMHPDLPPVDFDIESQDIVVADRTLTIPHSELNYFTHYYLTMDSGAVTDLTGNPFTGWNDDTTWSFWSPDNRAFTLESTKPFTEQQMNAEYGIEFVVNLTGDTIKDAPSEPDLTSDVALSNAPAGLTVFGTYWQDSGLHILLYFDGTDFDQDITNFKITLNGNALTSGKSVSSSDMTIQATLEPEIATTTPATNQVNVGKSDNLSMTFNKTVTAVSGKSITIYKMTNDEIVEAIDAADTSKVTVSGTNVSVQHNDFDVNTQYYVGIEAGAFVDADGIPYAGTSSPSEWTFKSLGFMNAPALAPATNTFEADPNGDLVMTFDTAVTGVAGKSIQIYKKSNNSLIDTIDAGNASKVSTSGGTVTIKHTALSDNTDYYVTVEAGAFQNQAGLINEAISASTDWGFKTVIFNPGLFFTDYVNAGNEKIFMQVGKLPGVPNYGGYSLWAYEYNKSSNQVDIQKLLDFNGSQDTNYPYLIVNDTFYSFMDDTEDEFLHNNVSAYCNDLPLIYNPSSFSVNAYVIKDASNNIIDVLGDITATTEKPLLPNGGTIVRKPGMLGGVSVFHDFQWTKYTPATYQFIGIHTN
ncbi:Ig-like domain-containing protein [Paenibacillus ferrarius]|uniref:Ig-like domain-containing protein n=1 Tax=Paenibacillus ferrarius TaxID=1469647 RepID=UPI003D274A9D